MDQCVSIIVFISLLILAQTSSIQQACANNGTMNHDRAEAAMQEAKGYSLKGDHKNAIAAYQKAADLEPDDLEIQNALVSVWQQALKENPLDPENHIGLGQAFQLRGDFGQAEEEYKQALRFSPGKTNPQASKLMAALAAARAQAIYFSTSHHPSGGSGGAGVKSNSGANSNPNNIPSGPAQPAADFGPYMFALSKQIRRAWYPPKGHENELVTVIFKVHRGGELSDLRLAQSAAVAEAKQAALNAVENAAPFAALPQGSEDSTDIQYTFSNYRPNHDHRPQ